MPVIPSKAISRGDFAHHEDRMIRTVVEAIRVHSLNLNIAACTEVARTIVSQYPATFADKTTGGEQIG